MKSPFVLVLLAVALGGAAAACSGSDDGGLYGPSDRRSDTTGATDPTEPTGPTAGDDDGDRTDPTPTDAGATPPRDSGGSTTDAGKDASIVDPSPFAGAPPYASTLGPSARKGPHPFTNDNPAGRPCFNCHGDNGAGTPMAFGGTVYANAAGTSPAPRVEIRVKDKDGKAISAWSDADGNFYFLVNPNGDLVLPGHAGIRSAKGTKVMKGDLTNGNCNGCHNANGAGRLVAP